MKKIYAIVWNCIEIVPLHLYERKKDAQEALILEAKKVIEEIKEVIVDELYDIQLENDYLVIYNKITGVEESLESLTGAIYAYIEPHDIIKGDVKKSRKHKRTLLNWKEYSSTGEIS